MSFPPVGIPFDVAVLKERVAICSYYPTVQLSGDALTLYSEFAQKNGLCEPAYGSTAPEFQPVFNAHKIFFAKLAPYKGTFVNRHTINALLDETFAESPISDEQHALQFRYLVHLSLNGANRQQHVGR